MYNNECFEEKPIILYGVGKDAKAALRLIGRCNVCCFCDNGKHNDRYFEEIPIKTFDSIMQNYNEELFVITASTPNSVYEITRQLAETGVKYTVLDQYLSDQIRESGEKYNLLNSRTTFCYLKENEYLVSRDMGKEAGALGSYFWQDLWAAKHIFKAKPNVHFDIGSRIDGFIAHLLSYNQRVKQIDIRPLESGIEGLEFVRADATLLEDIPDDSIESLSALCSLEHFGLGRYGDDIDPDACFKCFKAIQRKLMDGGVAYISVPISGNEHLEFNAHRVFNPKTIIDEFDELKLVEFSAAEGDKFYESVDIHAFDNYKNNGGKLFGLFCLKKMEK